MSSSAPPPAASRAAPPPKRNGAPASSAPSEPATSGRFSVVSGQVGRAKRVMIFGTGGIGKSSLAALAPKPVFLDIEEGTSSLDVDRVGDLRSWSDLRTCLQSSALDGFQTIVIDSATKAEEWAVAHVLATIKHEKGHKVENLNGYGFGKGVEHVYDTFLHLLVDCDRHIREGRNVVLVAHSCTAEVPNPNGEDFLQYQPRLQTTKKGNASIRNRVFEWCDHVLFLGYDVAVTEEGKGKGAGTRTIFTSEDPTHLAKVRAERGQAIDPRQFENAGDGAIWNELLSVKGGAA